MRKIDISKIELQIQNIDIFKNEIIRINWSSNIGFGQYTIYLKDNRISCYSEAMDCDKDKDFLKNLLILLVEKAEIKE
jgi:hypothetical protein